MTKPVAIVGGGPSGKMAARELVAGGATVVIFERESELGGLMRYGYPTYRMPTDVTARDALRLADLGIEFRTNWELGVNGSLDELMRDFDAVVLAIGASDPIKLGIPGEGLPNVWQALSLLHDLRSGSTSELGNRVLVIGGGDTAMDAATTSALGGADSVTVVYRGPEGALRALPNEVKRATQAGVQFMYLKTPLRITESKRRLTVHFSDGSNLEADSVVVAVGQRTGTLLTRLGITPAVDGITTNRDRLYLAGGITHGSDRLAPALASGRAAARAALRRLKLIS